MPWSPSDKMAMLSMKQMFSPGEFIINDLNTAGYGGNLEVTIREASGNIRVQVVPYSSIPQLLREGYSRYTATVGEIRSSNLSDPPMLFEGSYQYGFNNYITGYGGIQKTISTDYFALLGGVAFNTPIGALSFDATRFQLQLKQMMNRNVTLHFAI
ncbi:fimbria/pilus outer membrane usher protein [Yersinia sp. 2466 StPb PI]|uniref:fimbria/pilus outer membrane usher protein n=1 Tax=Yersinia sp. 2466 StPb PI TaxID=3061648 RepID=UPI00355C51C1